MTARARRALVGWSGFVGGSLDARIAPVARFRSTDVDQLPAADVDEVVCAGAPAEKWRANAEPEADRADPGVEGAPDEPAPADQRPAGAAGHGRTLSSVSCTAAASASTLSASRAASTELVASNATR